MRTTVTLDRDVERLLKEAMHRSRRSFRETLNRALRAALGRVPPRSERPAFVLTAQPLGLRAGLVTDAQIAALVLESDAVWHTTDTDFLRFAALRWLNPLSGSIFGYRLR